MLSARRWYKGLQRVCSSPDSFYQRNIRVRGEELKASLGLTAFKENYLNSLHIPLPSLLEGHIVWSMARG